MIDPNAGYLTILLHSNLGTNIPWFGWVSLKVRAFGRNFSWYETLGEETDQIIK